MKRGSILTSSSKEEQRSAGGYHPVVYLPEEYEVRDFTTGEYVPSEFEFDIGKYD